ncbi:hypothetical protein KC19_VG161600 [Ceratodon purpureus]|uniref:Uncharacterized protein n=1 Tax=Ceratodon purpureus TaxID=3225 RepID=A0A8T0HRT4_CERPU|nr:hypothetical protein KC19_VG161600 [Ceratodon purpureus]
MSLAPITPLFVVAVAPYLLQLEILIQTGVTVHPGVKIAAQCIPWYFAWICMTASLLVIGATVKTTRVPPNSFLTCRSQKPLCNHSFLLMLVLAKPLPSPTPSPSPLPIRLPSSGSSHLSHVRPLSLGFFDLVWKCVRKG